MRTPVLKRRLNPFLLVSTVLILSLLAGLSVLYQDQLSQLVSDKQQLETELEQKNSRISELEKENSNLSSELQSTENDLQEYINLYKSEKQQREELEDRISEVESNLGDLENRTTELENDVAALNSSLGSICDSSYENLTDDGQDRCEIHGHNEG